MGHHAVFATACRRIDGPSPHDPHTLVSTGSQHGLLTCVHTQLSASQIASIDASDLTRHAATPCGRGAAVLVVVVVVVVDVVVVGACVVVVVVTPVAVTVVSQFALSQSAPLYCRCNENASAKSCTSFLACHGLHSNQAPDCGMRGPYGVMKLRLCVLSIKHGPPAKRGSPLTDTVMLVGLIKGSEYSIVKRSDMGPSTCDGIAMLISEPPRTRNVYPLGQM